MSRSILDKVAKAIFDVSGSNVVPNTIWEELLKMPQHSNIISYYRERAKAAIGALRDLPIGTFDTMTESLVWIKIIDKIGKDIALSK